MTIAKNSICKKAAGVGAIQCSKCALWVHKLGVAFTSEQFDEYAKSERYFVSRRCIGEDSFDFARSLTR